MLIYIVTETDFEGYQRYTVWSDLDQATKEYNRMRSENMVGIDSITLDQYEVDTQRSWQLEKYN